MLRRKKRKKKSPRSLKKLKMVMMISLILPILQKKTQKKRLRMPRKQQRPKLKLSQRLSLKRQHPSQLPSSKKLSFQLLMKGVKFSRLVMTLLKVT